MFKNFFSIIVIFFSIVFFVHAAQVNQNIYQSSLPQATAIVAPSLGKSPLDITLNLSVDSSLTCTSFYIDWGDGSNPIYYEPSSFTENCKGGKFNRVFTHTYKVATSSKVFRIKAAAGPTKINNLSSIDLEVFVYKNKDDSYWENLSNNTDDQNQDCFLEKNTGFEPFDTQATIALGAGVCGSNNIMEYWIDWGDGNTTKKYTCNTDDVQYKTFTHTYNTATSTSVYEAILYKKYLTVGKRREESEKCSVVVYKKPNIVFESPDKYTNLITIEKPFTISLKVDNMPTKLNEIYPSLILGFTNTKTKESGFITSISAENFDFGKKVLFEWIPSKTQCMNPYSKTQTSLSNSSTSTDTDTNTEQANQFDAEKCKYGFSPITQEGIYTIDAYIAYLNCNIWEGCEQSDISRIYATSTNPIEISKRESFIQGVSDKIFVLPQSAQVPAYIYFTLVLNAEASCDGGVYTLNFGDGTSATIAYPQGKCQSFTESLAHIYTKPGLYNVSLIRNGVFVTQIPVAITKSTKYLQTSNILTSIKSAFGNFWVKIFSWLGID